MFNFDGDFRQRPQQNLGGATKSVDRNEIVRKAQHERHKRELLRTQQHSAVLIQSFIRSYLCRQKIKLCEKEQYDNYIKRKGSIKFEDLDFLLKRLIFFYNSNTLKDGERLVRFLSFI
jgi:ubiquitin-protein ligase E3 C